MLETTGSTVVEICLANGQVLVTRIPGGGEAASAELALLRDRLANEPVVVLGDLALRCSDVTWVRLVREAPPSNNSNERETMQTRQMRRSGAPARGGQTGMAEEWRDVAGWDETRPFFLTSEFLALLLGVTAVAICTAVFDGLDLNRGMTLITALVGAYMLSRGIAKAGSGQREGRIPQGFGMGGGGEGSYSATAETGHYEGR